MAKNRKKGKGGGKGREIGGFTESLVLWLERYSLPLSIVALLIVLALGIYVRILPALKYGLELDASDPWIVYWEAKYFHDHGLTSLSGLTDVKEFWWPHGRNFLKSEYLGIAWLAAATYPIGAKFGLTLRQWVALFPVFAGAAGIITIYILIERVTRSKIAGLVAASFFAFLPGSISRTTVGFVEKIGFAIPFIATFYVFMLLAVRDVFVNERLTRRALIYGVLAGIFGGSVAFIWGGFIFVILSYALLLLFDPIADRPSMERFKLYLISGLTLLAIMITSPKIGAKFFIANVGAAVPGALILYYIELWLATSETGKKLLPNGVDYKVQFWILAVVAVLAALTIQSGMIGFSNLRYAAALGIRNVSPLVESIAENQPPSTRALLYEYGIAMLIGLAGLAVFLVRVASGYKDKFYIISRTFFYVLFLFAVYINKQLAYFTQIASFYVVLASGVGTADIIMGGTAQHPRGSKRVVADPMKVMAAIFIVMIVGASVAYYGVVSYRQNSLRAPQILTSGLGPMRVGNKTVVPLNKAWLNAFAWIRNNTRPDAVLVAWWDYGYWLTVNTGRKTLADGVTFNETQIRWLAELLTGNESTASYLLRNKFDAEPGNTYVIFYDVFQGVYDPRNNNVTIMWPMLGSVKRPNPQVPGDFGVITHGVGDLGKSLQMLKISYRIDPFADKKNPLYLFTQSGYGTEYVDKFGVKWYHFPGFIGEPKENVKRVLNTLIYKLTMYGIPRIKDVGIFDRPECAKVFNNTSIVVPYVVASLSGNGELQPVIVSSPLKYFKPAAISVGCPIVTVDPNTGVTRFTAVVVFIFQWTG